MRCSEQHALDNGVYSTRVNRRWTELKGAHVVVGDCKLCSDQEMVPISLEESMLWLGNMPMSCWEPVLCRGVGAGFPPQLGHI